MYCGEWIESHDLHIYLLHAPDFLGYESAVHMARDHAELVGKALALKRTGNEVMTVVGGMSSRGEAPPSGVADDAPEGTPEPARKVRRSSPPPD